MFPLSGNGADASTRPSGGETAVGQAAAIDAEKSHDPRARLTNLIAQRYAKALLDRFSLIATKFRPFTVVRGRRRPELALPTNFTLAVDSVATGTRTPASRRSGARH